MSGSRGIRGGPLADTTREGSNGTADAPRNRSGDDLPTSSYAVRITLDGHVQGVGFRPFVYRLALEHGITGYVRNRLGEVDVVACGRHELIRRFRRDLIERAPPLSNPRIVRIAPYDTVAFDRFDIIASRSGANARVFVPPDYFMCDDCKRELADPGDRRYRYPFINCTQCGPRYTLIEALPYDRPNTSMSGFPLCEACETEYLDPANRRFHAEPVACPDCGPTVQFESPAATETVRADAALEATLERLHAGEIVAVKGIGGYHLMCDARNERAVATLRQRKHRPDKPFAVMLPVCGADGLARVREYASPAPAEATMLASPSRPIVLVEAKTGTDLADGIANGLRELGLFLPYSPLHQLLLDAFDGPLVATSGNVSGEPVLTDNNEVERRLGSVADAFLHHDRPIVRPADDPVYRRIAGEMRPLRVGRGCAPVELNLPWPQPVPMLAVGGHIKGTIALSWDRRAVVSPHIGEMDSRRSLDVFKRVTEELQALYDVRAERIVCDAHPAYTTHGWAHRQSLPVDTVWHHHAHASALAAETGLTGRWLVFAWDGVGLGEDGSLWGGEALLGEAGRWCRVASFKPFRLPGGERAGRQPWRSAAALHWESGLDWPDCPDPDGLANAAWQHGMNAPQTSAAGRLFDAAAALVLGKHVVSYEAEGPMLLESLCRENGEPVRLPLARGDDGVWRSDWTPLLELLSDARQSSRVRAERFHSSLAQVLLDQAQAIHKRHDFDHLGLSGGVFQNCVLTGQARQLLENHGFNVILPLALPCNDAALSYGQVAEMAARAAA